MQSGGGENGVERRAEEVRHDQGGHRRQHLEHDHVPVALATDSGSIQELAVAKRQTLRSQLPGAVGPPGNNNHGDQDREAARPRVSRDHDHQRQRRDHQEDIGYQGQHVVGDAAEVGGCDSDQHREQGGHQSRDQRNRQRLPRPPDELRKDVLAIAGGAEQMTGGGAEHLVENLGVRVVGSQRASKDRQCPQHRGPGRRGGQLRLRQGPVAVAVGRRKRDERGVDVGG